MKAPGIPLEESVRAVLETTEALAGASFTEDPPTASAIPPTA